MWNYLLHLCKKNNFFALLQKSKKGEKNKAKNAKKTKLRKAKKKNVNEKKLKKIKILWINRYLKFKI